MRFKDKVALIIASSRGIGKAIALGFVNTSILKRLPQELQDKILKQIPIGRFGEPEEVAKLVLFSASEDANYITGQVINLNGGYYMCQKIKRVRKDELYK